ncbi:uncharacterized protein LOC117340077 isoform X1 [Pecten maximus]|uniref:uncharacterized protein LOC117340077 isoform X1 n=1 Tax=Pecten maximus TaxID=6579 RepID=UPI0014589BFE|nr:uncharacterized protein LOC117340077 isoform X1 [Pecten maximus]
MSTTAVATDTGNPLSKGVFDPSLGRFVDSATRKPIGEVDTEEYLERLRMVHRPHLGLKPDAEKTINPEKENQGTEGGNDNSDSVEPKWGKYNPYSSPEESRNAETLDNEDMKESREWYSLFSNKGKDIEPRWYKYKPSKSLWDSIYLRTCAMLTPPSFTPVSVDEINSQHHEECTDGPKSQELPDKVKVEKKHYLWQSLLCCCRQQDLG